MKTLTKLVLLVVLVIFLVSACSKEPLKPQKTTEVNEKEYIADNGLGKVKVRVKAEVETTTDCGDITCFEGKFTKCKPATVTSTIMNDLVYRYQIVGSKNNGCEVKSKFLANPNPEWVRKEMTCVYDNTKKFEEATQDLSNCKGELYNLMTGG